jgi:hypothetical protein
MKIISVSFAKAIYHRTKIRKETTNIFLFIFSTEITLWRSSPHFRAITNLSTLPSELKVYSSLANLLIPICFARIQIAIEPIDQWGSKLKSLSMRAWRSFLTSHFVPTMNIKTILSLLWIFLVDSDYITNCHFFLVQVMILYPDAIYYYSGSVPAHSY